MPDVSVIIPTRDRWATLPLALSGALSQANVDVEVIVVDDASPNPAPPGLAPRHDSRVTVIRNETRTGVAGARNRGIGLARADWTAFLDDDDLWSPTKLWTQLSAARRTGADFVYSAAAIVDDDFQIVGIELAPSADQLIAELPVHCVVPAGPSNVLVRTEVVKALGGFNEQLSMVADWDLWIRLSRAALGASCPEFDVAYVLHDHNMHMVDVEALAEMSYITDTYISDPRTRKRAESIAARWRADVHRRAGRRRLAAREYLDAARTQRDASMLLRALAVIVPRPHRTRRGRATGSDRFPTVAWLESYRASRGRIVPLAE